MNERRRIAVLTGTRAEFGLLEPVMRAIDSHQSLELITIVTGTHLLQPARTIEEVAAAYRIDCWFEMQHSDQTGRLADVAAVGRGMATLASELPVLRPDVLLILGDRIEAFTGAAAAAIAGIRVAHMHGGDRAEGIADEALRHAITKLANIHLPATELSAQRIERMGEDPQRIHIVGSPAIDGLCDVPPLDEQQFDALGRPELIVMMHPVGRDNDAEAAAMNVVLEVCTATGRTIVLDPNHDAGRDGIMDAIVRSGMPHRAHLQRRAFIGLLRRAATIVGNSSAALIEAAALGMPAVNIGSRQCGREIPPSVIDVPELTAANLTSAVRAAMQRGHAPTDHPYGAGDTGRRVAEVLAGLDLSAHPITKRNAY